MDNVTGKAASLDEEATRLINDEPTQKEQNTTAYQPQQEAAQPAKGKKGYPVAAAAGGFVAGAAVGVGASAYANNRANEATISEDIQEQATTDSEQLKVEADAPAPEQAILANDEGIRYAHVEADNFSDAFAQARAQVGPGGVFEYEGRLYGTYYADEWNEMTPQERADYQNRVNENAPSHQAHSATHVADNNASESIPVDAEMISAEPVDNEIKVLGVETVQNENGQILNVALVECDGDQALLVDVDNNGTIDVLLHDDNGDGYIQQSEIHDISNADLEVAELIQAQAAQEGDVLYASYDGDPDYVNDADVSLFA